jgi:hypothetical protein
MSVKVSSALAVTLALILMLASWGGADAQGPGTAAPPEPRQERSAVPDTSDAPDISFISSPSATCYRPRLHSDVCYLNWDLLYVEAASAQYLISMTLTIDGQARANYQGFFQSAMYVPSTSHGNGFQVSCGAPGVDGVADMGHVYSWTLKARETGGLKAANYGAVTCPASTLVHTFLPLIRRQ